MLIYGEIPEVINYDYLFVSRQNMASHYCGYELFGFDVLLDAKLKPWLIEVNISPSLHSSSPLDLDVKSPLATEVFNLGRFFDRFRFLSVFSSSLNCVWRVSGFFREIATFLYRISSFNEFVFSSALSCPPSQNVGKIPKRDFGQV